MYPILRLLILLLLNRFLSYLITLLFKFVTLSVWRLNR
jgi:hypothetical protein